MKNLRVAGIKIQNTISTSFHSRTEITRYPITKTNNGYFPRCPLSFSPPSLAVRWNIVSGYL